VEGSLFDSAQGDFDVVQSEDSVSDFPKLECESRHSTNQKQAGRVKIIKKLYQALNLFNG
jgi:hypothetical protein